jgi:GNAT acetyltransferase-like protein
MNIKIINPINYKNWDELLLTNDQSTFFHTAAWAKVLHESYNYKPLYFTLFVNSKLKTLLPVMEVKSLLTGSRGVSLPFTDHCSIIASDGNQFQELFRKIIEYGKEAKWKNIEFRGGKECFNSEIPSKTFSTHILDVSQSEQKIFSTFRSSTKRNIKKAVKVGVQVKILNSLKSIKEFYRLNCLTRKDHGLPPQPFYFFRKLYEHIISTNKGVVALGFYRDKAVAGAVYSHFGNTAFFKYGASDKIYNHLRPNNLVMWEAIKWYEQKGYKSFNFGRTEPDNNGLLQFKRGWGTKEETIQYYNYDLKKDIFANDFSKLKNSYVFFRKMPLPLLKLVGNLFYRHIG